MTGTFNFELRSQHFEFLKGTAALVREPPGASLDIAWSADGVEVIDGHLRGVSYDGVSGRIVARLVSLDVRSLSHTREWHIPIHVLIHQLTEAEVRQQHADLELQEHMVVTIKLVDTDGQPLNNVPLDLLSALPESVSISGTTNNRGEFPFLARVGSYTLVIGHERHRLIDIDRSDDDERVVTMIHRS